MAKITLEAQRRYDAKKKSKPGWNDPIEVEKRKKYFREYYLKHRQKYKAYGKVRVKRIQQLKSDDPEAYQLYLDKFNAYTRATRLLHQGIKIRLQALLGGKCVECGITDHRLLDFDHIDPRTKTMNITRKLFLPFEILASEVAKCQLLCPNCHRLKTLSQNDHNVQKTRAFRNPTRKHFQSLILPTRRPVT